jgi:LDH2 family malate/lactate/ureidoglycolate dehydrogenase
MSVEPNSPEREGATRQGLAADVLQRFAAALFAAAGMEQEKADCTARLLVLTDMMGRRTHGLAMAPLYLTAIEKGNLRVKGEPEIVKDTGATMVWDGGYLPGLWLVNRAIEQAIPRADKHGVASVAIRKSHHIGCLAALVKQAADRGYIAIIANSEPAARRVAPFGGTQPLFTPNPFAIGYPGAEHPVLVDFTASITTTSMTREKYNAGEQFEHAWLLNAEGKPTRDPAVLEKSEPPGSLQLIGGLEYGHKGFGLALMIEALSQGLSGHGRLDKPAQWGGNVFLQVLNPDFFAGREAFESQMNFFSAECRANRPIHADCPVRVPGDQAARNIARANTEGISYDDGVWKSLIDWAGRLGVSAPGSERQPR